MAFAKNSKPGAHSERNEEWDSPPATRYTKGATHERLLPVWVNGSGRLQRQKAPLPLQRNSLKVLTHAWVVAQWRDRSVASLLKKGVIIRKSSPGIGCMYLQKEAGDRGLMHDFVHRQSPENESVVISYCVFCGECVAASCCKVTLTVAETAHQCRGGFHVGKLHMSNAFGHKTNPAKKRGANLGGMNLPIALTTAKRERRRSRVIRRRSLVHCAVSSQLREDACARAHTARAYRAYGAQSRRLKAARTM